MRKWVRISLNEILIISAVMAILAVILYPIFARHGDYTLTSTCIDNQRNIYMILIMYSQDNKDMLPTSSNIWKNVYPVLRVCPSDKKLSNGFLYNNRLSGINITKFKKSHDPSKTMFIVDGKTTISPNRMLENIYYTPANVQYRHYIKEKKSYYAVASYIDGHAEIVNKITEPESWDKPIIQKKTGVKK